jgi:hypothetical protein
MTSSGTPVRASKNTVSATVNDVATFTSTSNRGATRLATSRSAPARPPSPAEKTNPNHDAPRITASPAAVKT